MLFLKMHYKLRISMKNKIMPMLKVLLPGKLRNGSKRKNRQS